VVSIGAQAPPTIARCGTNVVVEVKEPSGLASVIDRSVVSSGTSTAVSVFFAFALAAACAV